MGRVSICTCWGEEKTGLEEEVCQELNGQRLSFSSLCRELGKLSTQNPSLQIGSESRVRVSQSASVGQLVCFHFFHCVQSFSEPLSSCSCCDGGHLSEVWLKFCASSALLDAGKLFSKGVIPVCFPTSSWNQSSGFSLSPLTTGVLRLNIFSNVLGIKTAVGLMLHFLNYLRIFCQVYWLFSCSVNFLFL